MNPEELKQSAKMVLTGDENVPAMPMNEAQVNHLRRLLAWMRCEYGSGGTIAELAQVSPSGQVVAITTSNWHGRVSLESPVVNQTALFSECGLFSFRETPGGLVSSSYQRVSQKPDCPFNPVPAQWKRIAPARGGN